MSKTTTAPSGETTAKATPSTNSHDEDAVTSKPAVALVAVAAANTANHNLPAEAAARARAVAQSFLTNAPNPDGPFSKAGAQSESQP
jgi:hypothetical protein